MKAVGAAIFISRELLEKARKQTKPGDYLGLSMRESAGGEVEYKTGRGSGEMGTKVSGKEIKASRFQFTSLTIRDRSCKRLIACEVLETRLPNASRRPSCLKYEGGAKKIPHASCVV
jgi:hypothetical protein